MIDEARSTSSTVDRPVVYSSQHEVRLTAQTAAQQQILFITASMDDYAKENGTEFNYTQW